MMRVLAFAICILLSGHLTAQGPVEIAKLQAELAQKGVQAVVETLDGSQKRLAAALTHVQPYLEEDTSQLWFQLQSRTRLEGWEDFQKQLRAQIPNDTLIALNSQLDSVAPNVQAVWRFGETPVTHLAQSSDGKLIYCGSSNGLAVIDPEKRSVVRRFTDLGFVYTTLIGPNGDLVCAARPEPRGQRHTALFDAQTGEELIKLQGGFSTTHGYLGNVPLPVPLITSPDGLKMIRGHRNISFICEDIDQSGESIRFSGGGDKTFCETVFMRFIEDGTQLLTADNRGHIRHFAFPDCEESQPGQQIKGAMLCGYDLSPDESMLACCFTSFKNVGPGKQLRSGEVSVWDRLTGRELMRHKSPDDALLSNIFLGDGETVIGGSYEGHLFCWKADGSPPTKSTPHNSPVVRLVKAPDGKLVFSGDIQGFVKLSDPMMGGQSSAPLPPEPTVRQHGVSLDGKWESQISKRSFKLLQVTSGKTLEYQLSDQDAAGLGEITSIALNSSRRYATLGGLEAVLHIKLSSKQTKLVPLDVSKVPRDESVKRFATRQRRPLPKLRVIVTPDTKHAVLWGKSAVASFNSFTGAQEFVSQPKIRHFGRRYGFLSGERIAINYQTQGSIGRTEGIRVYDLKAGKEVANFEHGAFQIGIAINPKTDTILTSGRTRHNSKQAKLVFVDANTKARQEHDLPETHGNVIGISEDGTRFLTLATRPAVVYVWDVATKKVIRRFDIGKNVSRGRLDGSTLVLTADSRRNPIEYWFKFHHVSQP